VSIRWLLLALTACFLAVILGSGFWMNRRSLIEGMETLSSQQFSLLAESLRTHFISMMRSGADDQVIDEEVKAFNQQWRGRLDLRLLHGPAITRQFGMDGNESPRDAFEKRALTGNTQITDAEPKDGMRMIRFGYPLRAGKSCLQCHDARLGEHLGAFVMKFDASFVQEKIRSSNTRMIEIYLTETVLLLFLLGFLMHQLIFKRLIALRDGAERFAAGDYSHHIAGESRNELGVVIREFNRMVKKVSAFIAEREEKTREQITQLNFLEGMSQTLTQALSVPDMLSHFTLSLTESIGVTCSCIALLDENKESLSICASHPVRLMLGAVEPGQVCSKADCPNLWQIMESRKHRLIKDFDSLSDPERKLFHAHDAKSVLCMPVIGKKDVLGLVVLGESRSSEREPINKEKIKFSYAMVSQAAAAIENGKLRDHLLEQSKEAVLAMAEAVDKKSPWTASHSKRVTKFSLAIAAALNWTAEQLDELRLTGLLHDIGKIGTPGTILNKEGKLTDDEYAVIKKHPDDGAHIISRMKQLRSLVPGIRHHHEWYNGMGYPDGLKGEEIPLAARILAVADAYDAMTADRPYRKGLSRTEALERLRSAAGEQFDPDIVEIFQHCDLEPSTCNNYVEKRSQ